MTCMARGCCPRGSSRGSAFIEPAVMPIGLTSLAMPSAPVLVADMSEPARDPAVAAHEGAHALASLTLGRPVVLARIGAAPRVEFAAGYPIGWRAVAAVAMAGPIAERWSSRRIWRADDAELLWFIEGVRNCQHGNCDVCAAFLQIVGRNPDATDEQVIEIYRNIETLVIGWITSRPVWRAVDKLAAALMAHGQISGKTIMDIIGADLKEVGAPFKSET